MTAHVLPTMYLDRETGEARAETVYGEWELGILYGTRLGRFLTWLVFKRRLFSWVNGLFKRLPTSRRRIQGFVDQLGVDTTEAELPLSAYRSLDAFFARRLKEGARTPDPDPRCLLAPSDGRVLAYPQLEDGVIGVKGCRVREAELVGDPDLAAKVDGGPCVVIRLAPVDYHRFHFPATGTASAARSYGRHLHAIHPIALGAGTPSFRNRRAVTEILTEEFGHIVQVEVGAMTVGSIAQTYRPGPVQRGDEKGHFHFGGSTIVLAFEPGRVELDRDLVRNTASGLETFVKVGTRIGCCADPSRGR